MLRTVQLGVGVRSTDCPIIVYGVAMVLQHRYSAPIGGAGAGKWDMEMKMTGRERRQYSDWKNEREEIDKERLTRQKNSEGDWRRAWDVNKTDEYVLAHAVS